MMKKEKLTGVVGSGGGGGGGVGMGLNLLLLVAMVAANILSLYHLSSTRNPPPPPPHLHQDHVPDHLLRQLHTIRATITHLTHLRSSSASAAAASTSSSSSSAPPELLLYSKLGPIASACSSHPDLLHRYMSYSPFSPCPRDHSSLAEPLLLRGCSPLPRRRCFSPTPSFSPGSLPDSAVLWPPTSSCKSFSCLPPSLHFLPTSSPPSLTSSKSALDLTLPQLFTIAKSPPIRTALDVAGGAAALAASLKSHHNVSVLTTTLNLGYPYSEAAALRGAVPLHLPLQQRFPLQDGAVDLVRTGHAVNRWIPADALEFLMYDVDRVLRPGGWWWVDHFFCRAGDLERVYAPMMGRLGYRRIKWAVGNKTDAGGIKYGEVYLTALLHKPLLPRSYDLNK